MTSKIVEKKIKVHERHVIAVLVDNEFGVLSRVIGLFSSRGYNISSVTVAKVHTHANVSRITIVTKGPSYVIEQIHKQLMKLVPVHEVRDLTIESPHIEREVALVKVLAEGKTRVEALKTADRFGARVVDSTEGSFIFELSDNPENIDQFIKLLEPQGLVEVCRTGITAISRGPVGMHFRT